MSGEQCPMRLNCQRGGGCDTAVIEYDTLDGYPTTRFQGEVIPIVGDTDMPLAGVETDDEQGLLRNHLGIVGLYNEVSNNWPAVVCDARGARISEREYGIDNYLPEDVARMKAVAQSAVNAWPTSLREAADELPLAPFADAFRAHAGVNEFGFGVKVDIMDNLRPAIQAVETAPEPQPYQVAAPPIVLPFMNKLMDRGEEPNWLQAKLNAISGGQV